MRNALVFLLLLTPFISAQKLAQLYLIGQPEHSASELVAIHDSNGRYCAAIQVISDMEGFSYDAYNGVVRVADAPGQDMVYLSPDERVMEIYHSGFEPLKLILPEIGIRMAGKEVWRIKIAGERSAGQIAITILSNPEGAEITLDGEMRGTERQQQVSVGSHELRLAKPGYQPELRTILVDESHTLFEYALKPQQDVTIRISSTPADATVYIDGVKVGQTPVANFYAAGRYRLRIEKERYATYEDFIDIQPPRTTKSYTLNPDFGDLTITSAPESGLEIYLDGRSANARTPYTFKELKAGTYLVKARSEFYETDEQEVVLGRGENKSISLSSVANFATLTIVTNPGAAVFMDGRKLTQWQNLRLQPAVVLLRAEMAKANPVEKRITLRKGESQTVELPLWVPSGTIQVAAVPEQANIELRGDAGEVYSATGDKVFSGIPIGSYKLTVSLSGYTEHTESLVLKEGERIARSVKLQVKTAAPPDMARTGTARGPGGADPGTGVEFVLIKGGTFEMGDVFGEGDNNEKPVHTVTVSDFQMGSTEVTVGQFSRFVTATGYRTDAEKEGWSYAYKDGSWTKVDGASWKNPGFSQDAAHPVVCVSWNDAMAYCQWAGYRLPTEAEWEYAARSGGRKMRYSWGTETPSGKQGGNVADERAKRSFSSWTIFNGYDDGYVYTAPVKQYTANEMGLFDLTGNVWEWCSDWYAADYYGTSPRNDPLEPVSGTYRVLRGGSWRNFPYVCRVTLRNRNLPDYRSGNDGFRVVRSAQ